MILGDLLIPGDHHLPCHLSKILHLRHLIPVSKRIQHHEIGRIRKHWFLMTYHRLRPYPRVMILMINTT